jgi:hypothetical protein
MSKSFVRLIKKTEGVSPSEGTTQTLSSITNLSGDSFISYKNEAATLMIKPIS